MSLVKVLLQLQDENQILEDKLLIQARLANDYRKELNKLKDDYKGAMWIIQEKDTELRIMLKEKDTTTDKML